MLLIDPKNTVVSIPIKKEQITRRVHLMGGWNAAVLRDGVLCEEATQTGSGRGVQQRRGGGAVLGGAHQVR